MKRLPLNYFYYEQIVVLRRTEEYYFLNDQKVIKESPKGNRDETATSLDLCRQDGFLRSSRSVWSHVRFPSGLPKMRRGLVSPVQPFRRVFEDGFHYCHALHVSRAEK